MINEIKRTPFRSSREKPNKNSTYDSNYESIKEKIFSKTYRDSADKIKSYRNKKDSGIINLGSSTIKKSPSTIKFPQTSGKSNTESTFYHSRKDFYSNPKDPEISREKDNQIIKELMYFVDNSNSIKKKEEKIPSTFEVPKEYFTKTDSLYKKLYHDDKFSSNKKKKGAFKSRAQSCGSYFNFDKSKLTDNNGKKNLL